MVEIIVTVLVHIFPRAPNGIFPWEIRVAFPKESFLQQSIPNHNYFV